MKVSKKLCAPKPISAANAPSKCSLRVGVSALRHCFHHARSISTPSASAISCADDAVFRQRIQVEVVRRAKPIIDIRRIAVEAIDSPEQPRAHAENRVIARDLQCAAPQIEAQDVAAGE